MHNEQSSHRSGAQRYHGNRESDSKMADSVQVEEPQRRAVGGTITTGRIHKGKRVRIGQLLPQKLSCKSKFANKLGERGLDYVCVRPSEC